MVIYSSIGLMVRAVSSSNPNWAPVADRLTDLWLDDYFRSFKSDNVVETRAEAFSYLFDIDAERLIAAWGVSQGRNGAVRPHSRMAGHPLGNGPLYHRGHAIPHTLGGGTDINLVPQLGSVNVGPFRPLEKQAVATPGSFYFTYWNYRGAKGHGQTPVGVDQGLLIAGQSPDVRRHGN